MSAFIALLIGAAGALAAWVVTNFVGKPIREFFDLKKQVLEIVMVNANVSAHEKPLIISADDGMLRTMEGRLERAERDLRMYGTKFHAFAQTEVLAVLVLRLLGYRPADAGSSLIGLSNSIGEYGSHRNHFRRQVERSLKASV